MFSYMIRNANYNCGSKHLSPPMRVHGPNVPLVMSSGPLLES